MHHFRGQNPRHLSNDVSQVSNLRKKSKTLEKIVTNRL